MSSNRAFKVTSLTRAATQEAAHSEARGAVEPTNTGDGSSERHGVSTTSVAIERLISPNFSTLLWRKDGMSISSRILLLALGPAVGLGIARFAYALILPDMRIALDWSYTEAGWMNTINAAGYLVGALLASSLNRLYGFRTAYVGSVFLCVLAIVLTGLTTDFYALSLWRLLSGTTGAVLFVTGGAAAATLSSRAPERSGYLLSLFYAGPGLGIAITGATVPPFLSVTGPDGWQHAWVFLGLLALILGSASTFGPTSQNANVVSGSHGHRLFSLNKNVSILLGYLLFGAGYIGYMTFMFTYLGDLGATTLELSLFWTLIGFSAMLSPWLWGQFITKAQHGYAFSLLVSVTLAGALIPLVLPSFFGAILSAAVFGSAFFAVVTATTAFVRRNAPHGEFTFAIGVFTASFGVGQTVGPIVIGTISDAANSLFHGLAYSCAALLCAVLLGSFQRDNEPAHSTTQRSHD